MVARGPALALLAFLGCGGTSPPASAPSGSDQLPTGELSDEDRFAPTYGRAELSRALISERAAEASGERVVAELEAGQGTDERLTFARADLAVRRRAIAALEACEATGRACPPRLDEPAWTWGHDATPLVDPKLDTPLRFDLDSWRKVAVELHGRACACRTITCVDSMTVALDHLEARPMADVRGDEDASRSLMWARECLLRLRGKKPIR